MNALMRTGPAAVNRKSPPPALPPSTLRCARRAAVTGKELIPAILAKRGRRDARSQKGIWREMERARQAAAAVRAEAGRRAGSGAASPRPVERAAASARRGRRRGWRCSRVPQALVRTRRALWLSRRARGAAQPETQAPRYLCDASRGGETGDEIFRTPASARTSSRRRRCPGALARTPSTRG